MASNYLWGTWLTFVTWIFNNFLMIKMFVKELWAKFPTEVNLAMSTLVERKEFKNYINAINSFSFVASSITRLESEVLSVDDQFKLSWMLLRNCKLVQDTKCD